VKVIVIGGGPAGVTAALRAHELGAEVTLIERERLGGVCTNNGCVPTRVFARAARLMRDAADYGEYGLSGTPPRLDYPALLRCTQAIIEEMHDHKSLHKRLRQSDIEVREKCGNARFISPNTIALESGETLTADRFIVCAGGHSRRLDFPGAEFALRPADLWKQKRLPASVLIVGASATGCQLATLFHTFGSTVTLVETADRLLPTEDETVSQAVQEGFTQRGITVHTGIASIARIEQNQPPVSGEQHLRAIFGDENTDITTETVVLCIGWPGNIAELHLGAAGVDTEKEYIVVDDALRTSVPHIFAAGDVAGRLPLVSAAIEEGRIAAENAVTAADRPLDHRIAPHGGFTDPEYGSVGLTEEKARQQEACAVITVSCAHLDRAIIDGHREGICKLIVSRETEKIVGAHLVGEQALEVVQAVAVGMAAGITRKQLAEMEFAYPTMTAILGIAARCPDDFPDSSAIATWEMPTTC
jgi:pyruvate/2-oxoglutarate dehydrogenase complex dihydrolipoamide dehydrogenase (E3) component